MAEQDAPEVFDAECGVGISHQPVTLPDVPVFLCALWCLCG
jgi:hypothetical protein